MSCHAVATSGRLRWASGGAPVCAAAKRASANVTELANSGSRQGREPWASRPSWTVLLLHGSQDRRRGLAIPREKTVPFLGRREPALNVSAADDGKPGLGGGRIAGATRMRGGAVILAPALMKSGSRRLDFDQQAGADQASDLKRRAGRLVRLLGGAEMLDIGGHCCPVNKRIDSICCRPLPPRICRV